jgi:hypothetical protein
MPARSLRHWAMLALTLSIAAAAAAPPAWAGQRPAIQPDEVTAAQKAWGDALVRIAEDHETGGVEKARATAAAVIDSTYGYDLGPVLFKPTLTTAPQTFRPTRAGALAYFVGQDPAYPADTGFALKGWRSVEFRNEVVRIDGEFAKTLGKVLLTDKDGQVTEVDKAFVFRRDDQGRLRIVLHHSSLPVRP